MDNKIIWKKVLDGYYEVSEYGDLRRAKFNNSYRGGSVIGRILKKQDHAFGYVTYSTNCGGVSKIRSAHRLVAHAFLGKPKKNSVVHHKDHNPKNNHYSNLVYVSSSENIKISWDDKRFPAGERSHLSKLNLAQVKQILEFKDRITPSALGEAFGVNKETIRAIFKGKTWSRVL